MSSKQVKKRRPAKKRVCAKKRTKKVNLDKNKVRLLCGVIFLICCVCIAFNIVIQSASEKQKESQKTVITKTQEESATEVATTRKEIAAEKKQVATEKKVQPKQQTQKKQESVKQNSSGKSENKSSVTTKTADKTVAKPENSKKTEQTKKTESVKSNSLPKKDATELAAKKDKTQQIQSQNNASKTESVTQTTKKTEKPPFLIPPAKNNATLVFVIDDAGLNVEYTKKYAGLPFPITIAVLPKLVHSKDCAYVVRSNGKELILHQPMQSVNHNLDPGPGKISVDMSFAEISAVVNANLEEIGPGVKGLNNHEGSEVTQDVLRIGAVLDVCQQNGIYFLDSRTTANTQAPQAALERDMKIYEKSGPYIDNVVSRQAMLTEIYKSLEVANKKGCAIVIGHVDKSVNILPALLEEMYPYMKAAGYKFATPSTLR